MRVQEIKMPAGEWAPGKLPVMRIGNAYVVVGTATLITEWMAKIVVRNGSIVARNSEEQVGRACFNIQFPQVLSIGKAHMFELGASPAFVDDASIRVATVLASWAQCGIEGCNFCIRGTAHAVHQL